MTCREVTDILDRYIEGDLPTRQHLFLKLHLSLCRNCRNYLRTYRQTIRAAKSLVSTPGDLPPMPEELVQAILASRAKAD